MSSTTTRTSPGAGERQDTRGGVDRQRRERRRRRARPRRVWTPTRIVDAHRRRAAAVIARAQRTARVAPSNTARNPSPVVSISRPRNRSSWSRIVRLWSLEQRAASAASPIRSSARRGVDDVGEQDRGEASRSRRARPNRSPTTWALVHSSVTNASSPDDLRVVTRRDLVAPIRRGSRGSGRRPSRRAAGPRSRSRGGGPGTTTVPAIAARWVDQRQPGSQRGQPDQSSSPRSTILRAPGRERGSSSRIGEGLVLQARHGSSRSVALASERTRAGRGLGGLGGVARAVSSSSA